MTDGPKPFIQSLQTIPLLFSGAHIESLSSIRVSGRLMYPEKVILKPFS